MPSQATSLFRILRWLLAAAVVLLLGLLRFGGDILIADDPAPPRVNAAIVLQGSIAAEKIRIAGAMNLLQRGVADKAVLSVPRESYWGQSIPPVARSYLERNYGVDLASRFEFCEMPGGVDSTLQEAEALSSCIRGYHWQSIVIVTSNYHTRRAGMLWRRITKADPNLHVWVEGVADPEFQPPWWRHRQSAKVWLLESSKLVWAIFGG
ncbi:MAG: ElyC/SanA/YdcF family protein [Candidatus Sulfotelmatobacter sp.]